VRGSRKGEKEVRMGFLRTEKKKSREGTIRLEGRAWPRSNDKKEKERSGSEGLKRGNDPELVKRKEI